MLALSLHQLGTPSTLFAPGTEMGELGVGINILPDGARELVSLGLPPELNHLAIRPQLGEGPHLPCLSCWIMGAMHLSV